MSGDALSPAEEEIAAARDYWGQIFARSADHPMATLVPRDAVLEGAADRAKALLAERGVAAEEIDDLADRFAADLAGAPITSPGVDPHAEVILGSLCDRIETAIAGVSKDQVRVARGIEPKVGAFAARLGVMMTDASVITVGSQLFRFCNVVGKAMARTIMIDPKAWDTIEDPVALRQVLQSQPDIVRYWVDILLSYALTGTNIMVERAVLSGGDAALKDSIVDAMEIFAVAHEYSHHLQRHGRLLEASSEAGADRPARGEEFEADSIAIMIGQMVTGFSPAENLVMISGAGMAILLSALDLLAKTRAILALDDLRARNTHPTPQDRLAMIDRQPHLWGADAVSLSRYRATYVRILGAISDEVFPFIEHLASTDEFRAAAAWSRKQFGRH